MQKGRRCCSKSSAAPIYPRAYHRVLKLARTIADLADAENILTQHIAEAVQYRRMDRQQ
jgi:predicted ATPase with chaperone activity